MEVCFKGIKSIVSMSLVENEPVCSWTRQNPREYGFYSNVNPDVDHPRWSQKTERRIGGGILTEHASTSLFVGCRRARTWLCLGFANRAGRAVIANGSR